jgi:signal transduction histidine kinase
LSHELRTPLNPVLLLASAAEDPALPEHVRAQFRTIRHNVELEARLIDDLLDITRIAHGKLTLNMAVVDAHALLKEALATVRSDLDHKGISLTLELEAEHSAVKGDAVRLQQVLWNVLKNAVKFTAIGGKIGIGTLANAGTGELVVSITDNGIGLTDRDIARIFEGFTQGEHAAAFGSHRFGGLGLGLTISRKLLELHGGSIQASSAGRDQGSTFNPLGGGSRANSRNPGQLADASRLSGQNRRLCRRSACAGHRATVSTADL